MPLSATDAKHDAAKVEALERLVAELRHRLPAEAAPSAADLLRRCYANTPHDELASAAVDDLLGPVLALWNLAQQRQRGEIRIHVYNPQRERDGWSSPHTAIDVINDDMPFLLASTNGELQQRQRRVHVALHPVLGVERDASGRLQRLLPRSQGAPESWMHLEIDRETTGEAGLQALATRLVEVLGKVRATVSDWRPMLAKAEEIEGRLRTSPPPLDAGEVEEAAEFLRWLTENHFTFLGYRGYAFEHKNGGDYLRLEPGSGLGLLREVSADSEERSETPLPDYLARFLHQRELLIITKGSKKSEVHRPVHMDSIGIRRFDAEGKVVGEDRFLGLFTSSVYNSSAQTIPVLRRKVRRVFERASFNPGSHDAKALAHVLESFPRDELFQISEEDLYRIAIGILQLHQRQRVALFLRKDEFERFVSALVFVPRDRYTFELRERLQKILERALGGEVTAFYTQVGDAALARVHFIVRTTPGQIRAVDVKRVEAELAAAARTWREDLREQLVASRGEEVGLALAATYGEAFPPAYRDRFGAAEALADLEVVERLLAGGEEFAARLYRSADMPAERMRIKLYLAGRQIALTDALPLLENLGVRVEEELPFGLRPAGSERGVWVHDFALVAESPEVPFETAKPLVEESLRRVWRGDLENG
ncbi:MAG TPA: NAD-glutamate dehydrogenase, partial [Thermoanaerobaculia bacterium]|nr:NAD-glutamate dehydrogenase [Thermoanaerobaculia bacterium]